MVTLQPRESSAYRFEEASTALTSSGPVIPNPILVAGLGCAFGSGSACCSNTAKSAKLASPSADEFSVNTKHDVKIQNTHFVGDLNTKHDVEILPVTRTSYEKSNCSEIQ